MDKKKIVIDTIEFNKPKEIPVLLWVDGLRFEMKDRKLREVVWESIKDRCHEHLIQMAPDGEENQCVTLDWPKTDIEWRDAIYGWKFGTVMPVGGYVLRELAPVYSPLSENFDPEKVRFPDPNHPLYLKRAENIMELNRDKYLIGLVWLTLFEKMHLIAGFENIFVSPYSYLDKFLTLRDKVMDFNLKSIRRWLDAGVDAIFISDDWGTKDRTLISLEQWQKYYKPCYQEMINEIHKGGAHAWFHSCGHIVPFIDDLISIGLDVLHPIQPEANDFYEIKEKFGGKICFAGGLNVQQTLPNGSPEEVELEVKNLFNLFAKDYGGGIIPGPSNTIIEDTSVENIIAIYTAIDEINSTLNW